MENTLGGGLETKKQQKPHKAALEAKIRVSLEEPEGIPPTRPTLSLRGTAPHASWAPGPPAGSGDMNGVRRSRPSPPARPWPPGPPPAAGVLPSAGWGTPRGSLTRARDSDAHSAHAEQTRARHIQRARGSGEPGRGVHAPRSVLSPPAHRAQAVPPVHPRFGRPRAPPAHRRQRPGESWSQPRGQARGRGHVGGCKRTSTGKNCRDRTHPDSQDPAAASQGHTGTAQ
uniref:Uncharacterized protein n=1 Tax=Myotis myotis TaxID=51298 RepID=A0A7J7RSZ7_MYOMY|nr:hypothetical protein mMyoMyo1_010180 [Myotis myotis]